MDYTFWNPGEPNSGDAADYCCQVWHDHDGHWDDNPCNNAKTFICQKLKGKILYSFISILLYNIIIFSKSF